MDTKSSLFIGQCNPYTIRLLFIPTIGATGEGVNLGGNLYPTDLVLWIMWLVNITVAGIFLIYATRPR